MKKTVCAFALIFAALSLFAEKDKIVRFDLGLATGIPVYNKNDVSIDGNDSRAIFGSLADIAFRVTEPMRIVLGSDLMCDFTWDGGNHSHHVDYAFWGGIKVYPGFGGLSTGLSYALGCRTDFVNDDETSGTSSSAWGNGFRLSIDYDFLYGTKYNCAPALGGYYRLMPRGENHWDNIFAVYITLGF